MTIGAEDRSASRCRPDQIDQNPNRRRFAGAIQTEEAEDLALLHVEGHVLQRRHAPVAFDETFETNSGHAVVGHRRQGQDSAICVSPHRHVFVCKSPAEQQGTYKPWY